MKLVLPAFAAFLLVLCSIFASSAVMFDPSLAGPYDRLELIPYILLLAVAVGVPNLVLARRGSYSFAQPFVYASWTYLWPMLIGGSIIYVMFGVSDIPEDTVVNPAFSYRLTLVYLSIGMAAYGLGTAMEFPRKAGNPKGWKLPGLKHLNQHGMCVAIGLIALGVATQYINFSSGLIGYQLGSYGRFSAFFYYLGLSLVAGQYLFWHSVFSRPRKKSTLVFALTYFFAAVLAVALLNGSRGYLVSCWIVAALALFQVFPRPSWRQLTAMALAGVIALAAGFMFGTLFRNLKAGLIEPSTFAGSSTVSTRPNHNPDMTAHFNDDAETSAALPSNSPDSRENVDKALSDAQRKVGMREQSGLAGDAVKLAIENPHLPMVGRAFLARVNTLTQVAVLVSKRDAVLEILPHSLKSGILIGIATALVPRALWPDKPVIGDVMSHAKTFFGVANNAFAITPVGDLYLNFGAAGIVPGMIVLGIFISTLYAWLAARSGISPGWTAVYVLMLQQISMESFYSQFFPSLLRTAAVAVAIILCADFIAQAMGAGFRRLKRNSGS